MLLNFISSGGSKAELIQFLLTIPIILFSLSFHEYSHAYAAYKMGDPTARNLGRMTLNPIKHLDPLGTVMMLLIGFGYAKPVPVNSRNFKNAKKGMALTAFAGPLSNLFLAIVSALILRILIVVLNGATITAEFQFNFYTLLLDFFYLFHILNLSLAVFNMIPIPPLDGSRLANIFLPDKIYFGLMKYERYIMLALIAVVFILPRVTDVSPVWWVASKISEGIMWLIGLIPGL